MVTLPASIAADDLVGWRFDNTYSRLTETLFAPAQPATARTPKVSILNHGLAEELGLNLGAMSSEAAAALFAGQVLPSAAQPIAQAYAGHYKTNLEVFVNLKIEQLFAVALLDFYSL